ncbi:MAG: aminotransferase class V-fold PLP-dependent enzyme [Caldilinea sp.]
MQSYQIPLVPGPVSIPSAVRAAYAVDYASADLEVEFFGLYERCERKLQAVLGASAQITIQTGEGMLALWGALKSVVRPGDRVLAVGAGLFGVGIGEMARQIGAEVEVVNFPFDSIVDPAPVREAALRFRPKLVTAVHCETPSGTLNPLEELGRICREVDALFYVDFVASGGGVAVDVDRCAIDLGLLGSQKVLSLPPDLSMVTVSERAWESVSEANYAGYDALAPWQNGPAQRYLPYTHNWGALAALEISLDQLLAEGMEAVYARHAAVASSCRRALDAMGVRLFPVRDEYNSPTVTAAYVPQGWMWLDLDRALREHGMAVGGNYGDLAGKVFRIGHMGSQADSALLDRGMDVLRHVLGKG